MSLDEVAAVALALDGVRETDDGGRRAWRYHGRLVARAIDGSSLVVRADFDVRDALRQAYPRTFSVPPRYEKHMMVVADLTGGDRDAVEDAITAAWRLQSEGS